MFSGSAGSSHGSRRVGRSQGMPSPPPTDSASLLGQMLQLYGPMMKPEHVVVALHTSTQVLADWRSRGTHALPYTKIGRAILYPTAGVADFLDRNTVRPVAVDGAEGDEL